VQKPEKSSSNRPDDGGRGGGDATSGLSVRFASVTLLIRLVVGLAALTLADSPLAAAGVEGLWRQTYWGESANHLRRQFGTAAVVLPRALDFGDSYVDVLLPSQTIGGVSMVVFFQMDKASHGLKRIQLERPRHGVNPPAFRGLLAALQTEFGRPDRTCAIPVYPASGYQAAAEALWVRDDAVVSVIFRDTTLQAFEGCLFGPATGSCGLTGQLLVRVGPPAGDGDPCSLERPRDP
jgi:hypothetical protein